MRKLTKMMLMGGGDGHEQESARREWRITEESRRGGQGTRTGYGGEEDRYPRMGGYESEDFRRRDDTRSEYEGEEGRRRGSRDRSEYEPEESRRRRRDRRGRFTRSGGYEDDDEDYDPRAVYQDEESYWPPMRREHEAPVRGGYAPRREYMPEAGQDGAPNIIGFAVQPHRSMERIIIIAKIRFISLPRK